MASAQLARALALEGVDSGGAEALARGAAEVAGQLVADNPGYAEPHEIRQSALAFLDRLLRDRGRDAEADAMHRAERRQIARRIGWPESWSPVNDEALRPLLGQFHPAAAPASGAGPATEKAPGADPDPRRN
ncbi:MAG: hypothetical protein K2X91_03125, partial [Thermoleophilia bacterium]|nr:hypothetical protein [Thermoleophilia bacterium]